MDSCRPGYSTSLLLLVVLSLSSLGKICQSDEGASYILSNIALPVDTAVNVAADECPGSGDVRLVSNQSTTEGRVEVCLNGEWGTICDVGWDTAEAEVVCRQLNLTIECEL